MTSSQPLGEGSGGAGLSLVISSRTRGKGMKPHQGKLRLDLRRRFSTERMAGPPREEVMAPSLAESRERLDNAYGQGLVLGGAGSWTR